MLLGEAPTSSPAPTLSPAVRRSGRARRLRFDLSGTESDRSSARPVARVIPQKRKKEPSPPRRSTRRRPGRPEPAVQLPDGSFDTEFEVSPLELSEEEEEQGQ